MKLREVKPATLKKLSQECEDEFKLWNVATNGRKWGTQEPLTPYDIFRYAFSKGTTAVLSRVDNGQLKEEV